MKKGALILLFLLCILLANAQKSSLSFGINICGAEFGENNLPGILNKDYTYPTTQEIDYFFKKGFKVINLPFRWERIQHKLGGELETKEVEEIKKVLYFCASRNMKVILSLHNFGRYKTGFAENIIGSPQVTREQYKDVWKKIATAFKSFNNIYGYNLMAEPHDMRGFDWFTTAQQAINGIRTVDKRTNIIVEGENYSCSQEWLQYNDNLRNLKDPYNKIIYNAHCYFDDDHSGKYLKTFDENKDAEYFGIHRVKPFADWLQKNNKKGMIGEFGVPAYDKKWFATMDKFLEYISNNKNIVLANYWAAGTWWYDYKLSIEPTSFGSDKPQMKVLAKYIYGISNTASSSSENQNTVQQTGVAAKKTVAVAKLK
jgi:endoglucanase